VRRGARDAGDEFWKFGTSIGKRRINKHFTKISEYRFLIFAVLEKRKNLKMLHFFFFFLDLRLLRFLLANVLGCLGGDSDLPSNTQQIKKFLQIF
jgi:hypothetical protein